MAFGLGYNKAKILSAAEKYVMQGKIPAAINEYQKILENEPRDLTILNIVGDLYLRINKNEEALKCFYKLGGAYLDDGFTRNAIAVFRRITRVDASQIDAVVRLAELYTLQGQLGEARGYYQQAAEYYGSRRDDAKTLDVMEKLLLLDPQNVSTRQRLAVMYEQAKRPNDAAAMYLSVAEAYADQANPAEAEKALKRARDLGLFGPEVLLLQARIYMDAGQPAKAIETMAQLPEENIDKVALNVLFHAHSGVGNLQEATTVARRLLDEHDDVAGLAVACDRLVDAGQAELALENYRHMADRLISERNISPLVDGVQRILRSSPKNVDALKLLRDVYRRTEDQSQLPDVTERLASAAERSGDYALARELYQELLRLEPGNTDHQAGLRLVEEKLGVAAVPAAPPPTAAFAEEFIAAPTAIEQTLSESDREMLDTAVNESDLYLTYRQIDKALAPLEAILHRLPDNIVLNDRLLSLYQRAENWGRAAERASVLCQVYRAGGDHEKAETYEEQANRFRERAGGAAPAPAVSYAEPEFAVPSVNATFPGADTASLQEFSFPSAGPEVIAPAVAESGPAVREVDLSDWESMMAPAAAAPPPAPPANLAEGAAEIESCLRRGMIAEATTALSQLQEQFPGAPELESLAERVAMAAMGMPMEGEPAPPPPPPAAAEMSNVQEFQFDVAAPSPAQPAIWEPEAEAAPPPFEMPAAPPPVAVEVPVEPPPEPVAPPVAATPAPPPPAPPAAPPLEVPVAATEDADFVLALEEGPAPATAAEVFELALDEDVTPAVAKAPRAPAPPPVAPAPPPPVAAAPPAPPIAAAPPPPPPPVAAAPPPPVPPAAAAPPPAASFESLVGALEDELADLGGPAPATAPPPTAAHAASAPSASAAPTAAGASRPAGGAGQLDEVFQEFREGMEDNAEADIETHFNMGVAFKEMHLFDEAIGEFQKAFQAAQRARSYANYVRCCTLLAHCFTEKGLPALAVRWIENALKAPGLEQEDVLALRYELGSAHELAGNKKAALDSFMEVYALNIDYRDVAERIRELQAATK